MKERWEIALFSFQLGGCFVQFVFFLNLVTQIVPDPARYLKNMPNFQLTSAAYSTKLPTRLKLGYVPNCFVELGPWLALLVPYFFSLPLPPLGRGPYTSKLHYLGFVKHRFCLLCKSAARHKW